MKKMYKVSGNDKIGHRIIIPSCVERAEAYTCRVMPNGRLIYDPVRPRILKSIDEILEEKNAINTPVRIPQYERCGLP